MTVVAALIEVQSDLESLRDDRGGGPVARELSIAITAIEDAIMRTNRAFAKDAGTFKVADVEALNG